MSFSLKYLQALIVLSLIGQIHTAAAQTRPVLKGATPFATRAPQMNQQSCGKVDLAPAMGPVHNQTAGTCFAYTALDLMNFGTKKRYSPLHLATLQEYKKPGPPLVCPGVVPGKPSELDKVGGFTGGWPNLAIGRGMQTGLCPETVFPATVNLQKDYLKLLKYYQQVQLACQPNTNASANKLAKALTPKDLWRTQSVQAEMKRLFPTLNDKQIDHIATNATSSDHLIKWLGTESCCHKLEKNVPPGKTPAHVKNLINLQQYGCDKYYDESDRAKIFKMINDALNKGKPAGIAYITGGLIQEPQKADHGLHASVVAGRNWMAEERNKQGQITRQAGCYYLVKNSWGTDWKVRAGLKAKSSSQYPGYFVVSEKQLMEHTFGATYID